MNEHSSEDNDVTEILDSKIPPLRLFVVRRDYSEAHNVIVEAHGCITMHTVLCFFTWVLEGREIIQYTHRAFKDWTDVEELPVQTNQQVH